MYEKWIDEPLKSLDGKAREAAKERQSQLTKPPGSLGQLEHCVVHLAAMQGKSQPTADDIHIVIFAADHGIAASGVSVFPQAVTTEMVRNFSRGGAAISVLARELSANLSVVNVGTLTDPGTLPGVIDRRIAASTHNFLESAAMSSDQLHQALQVGRESVDQATTAGADLFIGGEMGIGNTSSASAMAARLLGRPAADLCGPGTGLDAAGVRRKALLVEQALQRHAGNMNTAREVLRHLGGFEIAALTGAYLRCAQIGMPAIVDGFIASTAALCCYQIAAGCRDWMLFGHRGAEPGHRIVLQALHATPIVELDMRLGEASGAATAARLLQLACALHRDMATFAEAGVSDSHR